MSFAERIRAAIPPRGSLARRIMIWHIGSSFLIVLIASAILHFAAVAEVDWVDDQVLERRMHTIRDLLQGDAEQQLIISHEVAEDIDWPRQINIRVLSATGEIWHESPGMADSLPPSTFPAPDVNLDQSRNMTFTNAQGDRFRALVVRVPAQARDGSQTQAIIQVATDTTLDALALWRFQRNLALVIGAALIACAFMGWSLVRAGLRPLRAIADETSKIGSKTLANRVPLRGLPDELRELATQFNSMLERLEVTYTGLRQYADNVAHELRTPINKMLLGAEIALMSPRSDEEYRDALANQVEECTRLSHLVERLLFLARADNKQQALELQTVDLAREVDEIREYYAPSAAESGVDLRFDRVGASPPMAIDRTLFQRAIGNLLSNALSHTPRGGAIRLSVSSGADAVKIVVADNGEGIAAEHLQHLFDRFYRADEARSGAEGRLGLGLAIVKSIVELHGGAVAVESGVGKGTRVTLTFPMQSDAQVEARPAPEPVA